MGHPYVYVGCFVRRQELLEKVRHISSGHLYRIIENPHVTFAYKPESVDETLFGEPLEITMTGYANDGKNEGVKVELTAENPRIREMIAQIEVPHITLSVSETGESVNTRFLDFSPITPIKITGKYGGFITVENVVLRKPVSAG